VDITTPLGRLKAFMTGVVGSPFVVPQLAAVSQRQASNLDDPLDPGAVIYPPPTGYTVNPNPETLADIPQVWGYRRDTWFKGPSTLFYSNFGNQSYYRPVSQRHVAASQTTDIPGGLHFIHTGQAFEVLYLGTYPWITVIADGQYATSQWVRTAINADGTLGSVLSYYDCFTKFDFGSVATRRISVYGLCSNVGPCAIAIGVQDKITPWDRSLEPSFCVMADSYGQGSSLNWPIGGPFWVAASLLGIPHIDLNAQGGTGYAPIQSPYAYTSNPGNTFGARIADSVKSAPDLFMTGGSINDDYGIASPPLYPTVTASNTAFQNAVSSYYKNLRAALPNSVIAAMGPWAPRQSIPTSSIAQGKLNVISSVLQSITGPWVLIDNLNGGWLNSSGASGPQTGPWQTGTGNAGAPTGVGNGDIYVSADGTHPTPLGHEYLGRMLASSLAAAILAL
jgi:lysophospholipase L1-like esterase